MKQVMVNRIDTQKKSHGIAARGLILIAALIIGTCLACSRVPNEDSNPAASLNAEIPFSTADIDSPAKFAQFYAKGIPTVSEQEYLEWQKKASNGAADYLLVPATSAMKTLNLVGGQVKDPPTNLSGKTMVFYAWNEQNGVWLELAQPVKQGMGGIWWVTGYNSLTEDGLYWYDDIVNFSDGMVEIMGTKIGYERPAETEAKRLLDKITDRQREVIMSRSVKCYIAAKKGKYLDLKALCTGELAREIEANIQGGNQNIYGGRFLIELKNSLAEKPEKIFLPQATENKDEYSVKLKIDNYQTMMVYFNLNENGEELITKVAVGK